MGEGLPAGVTATPFPRRRSVNCTFNVASSWLSARDTPPGEIRRRRAASVTVPSSTTATKNSSCLRLNLFI
jgi:hypothetical protein